VARPSRPVFGPIIGGADGSIVTNEQEAPMLGWAIMFFVVAIIAAIFGFGGIAGAAAGIAQVLFFVFLILFAVSVVASVMSGRRPPAP
jgi:uncharacterized membrane protein YtjA (UPF0391 family)